MEDFKTVAKRWTTEEFDKATRDEVSALIASGNTKELEDRFYRMLEFGTGGLRGVMGVGTNRMNNYTVAMATQGLANYLLQTFPKEKASIVISYDSRNNSKTFAEITADVMLSNGIKTYLFDALRPTPELSFSIRHLGCKAGVMVTASHNPKEYNGYKVYWEDGAQITPPHDKNIIAEVAKITSPSQVKMGSGKKPEMIGAEVDRAFLDSILSLMLSPDAIKSHSDIKIVYTPLHGTGVKMIPVALDRLGFKNIIHVPEQDVNDGDFPTVASPNPEEHAALEMAIARANETGAELVMASDPDADRVGAAVRDDKGEMILLNGNQTAAILTSYILTRWKELGKINDNCYCVKTIVTTELLKAVYQKFGVKNYNVLTGFKYIAEIVRENEGKGKFICGGEESYGFNLGEFVRDKDAVVTCSILAECAAWLASKGKTIYGYLQDIYAEYGYYREALLSMTKKGKDGLEQIQSMMAGFREKPFDKIAGSKVTKVVDYNFPETTGLPKSNVLQFFTEDGSVISVRPSGTEPKIKFYFGAHGEKNIVDSRIEALNDFFKNV